ncbi:class I SAM-dependent methyltransferase [Streptomyces sp. 549]|uniref:class I SAM-dependent methyltransferase n=1 Tax=Streptomyces sp. 549 TaxID=3049076 RepID=UPI0024C398F5|nr:class I SAM-dependent methyltransferase [Streptomyces sp. 549]MDK1476115.1 class I SAM-dependent methyltransferase [Streptomyces sp. 549]
MKQRSAPAEPGSAQAARPDPVRSSDPASADGGGPAPAPAGDPAPAPEGRPGSGPELDEARVEEFAGRLFETYAAGMLNLMIDLAYRTGLLEQLAAGPGTSEQLAERSELTERYVRECLGALVTGGLVEYAPKTGRYALPPEHAVCLTGEGALNLAPYSRITTLLAQHVPGVARAFREGGGVPYEAYRPEFTDVMDESSRGDFDGRLLSVVLPLTGDVPDRLAAGARAGDLGCGTGHAVNVLAAAFPASHFTGYDLAADAVERGRAEAAEWRLGNADFEVLDVTELPADPPFDVLFAFDAVHDQAAPDAVLARAYEALRPGGVLVMVDIKASSSLEGNIGNPMAPWLYGVSTLHCMTVSLARSGAGLGTVWGVEQAQRMLADARFAPVALHDIPEDPMNCVYVAHRPA